MTMIILMYDDIHDGNVILKIILYFNLSSHVNFTYTLYGVLYQCERGCWDIDVRTDVTDKVVQSSNSVKF